jgi:hypothetical protein
LHIPKKLPPFGKNVVHPRITVRDPWRNQNVFEDSDRKV